ncbi:hypothetical protein PG996_011824, partial [Apiospora saccharicola]
RKAELPQSNRAFSVPKCKKKQRGRDEAASSKYINGRSRRHQPIADVPGAGIVLPNGTHIYYIDVAPNTEGVMVSLLRFTSRFLLQRRLGCEPTQPPSYSTEP